VERSQNFRIVLKPNDRRNPDGARDEKGGFFIFSEKIFEKPVDIFNGLLYNEKAK